MDAEVTSGYDAPATPAQVRALMAAFDRLGLSRRSDRPERLAVATAALGLDEPLRSFNELLFGQAGYLLSWTRRAEATRSLDTTDDPDVAMQVPMDDAEARPDTASRSAGTEALSDRLALALDWCSAFVVLAVIGSRQDTTGSALGLALLATPPRRPEDQQQRARAT